jgi:hypothetical protein
MDTEDAQEMDPNAPTPGEGQQLSNHVASAWSLAADLKEHAGRGEVGRQASIIASKLEELRALIAYYNLCEARIERGGATTQAF